MAKRKSLSKVWLQSLSRMVDLGVRSALPQPARRPRAAAPAAARAPQQQSAVRPSDWQHSQGWQRAFYSAPPGPGQWVNHMAYGLYLPQRRSTEPAPLVVMLHGCQQNADEFARGTGMNALADRYGFAVLYPEQSPRAHPHRCWRWYDDGEAAGGLEAASIAALTRQTIASYGLDPSRVYVAGMSAGAGMATLLAIRYPTLFAALAVHSGAVFGAANSAVDGLKVMRHGAKADPLVLIDAALAQWPAAGMPAILLHGNGDAIVDPVNADQLALQWLRLNRMADAQGQPTGIATIEEPLAEHGVRRDYLRNGRPIVRVCRFDNLGHAWSGGDGEVAFHSGRGPQASELIWAFFRMQRRKQVPLAGVGSVAASEVDDEEDAVASPVDLPGSTWPFSHT